MRSKIKLAAAVILGLLALGAVNSPAASATDFTAASYPAALHGTSGSTHAFEVGTGVIQCQATFAGTMNAASTTQTMTPTYTSCQCYGLNCTVTMNGCDYALHSQASGTNGTLSILCPAGNEILIDTAGNLCNTHIKPQTGLGGLSYANNGNHIDVTTKITTMHMVVTGTFLCPVATSTKTFSDGKYTGSVTLQGNAGGTKIDVG
jgi:hypothetical protein